MNEQDVDRDDFTAEIQSICQVKVEEFTALGYESVKVRDIWRCAKWLTRGTNRLYALVDAILSMRIDQFMNFQMANAYRGMLDENDEEHNESNKPMV
ncbi:post-transcriptional regulator [Alicyclobacillus tolerans]|uniref:Post-transcriptional regulator n=2 Tax=Alicyclobacillus tolerans TaxID=90970 RepID=A0A1M6K9T6_9BACL|nr:MULTISPECIES: post-transcriptional regulator [Alicyclobacillus]MDP9727271.1 hypothetical protein [Alicyclobacillus tengchongensis]SHJ55691.1 Post-transcriptional regulator [Alicyclobacillus montanus]